MGMGRMFQGKWVEREKKAKVGILRNAVVRMQTEKEVVTKSMVKRINYRFSTTIYKIQRKEDCVKDWE